MGEAYIIFQACLKFQNDHKANGTYGL